VHYAWVVAGVTFLALLASAGISATRAVLVLPLEREFGWDRATISLALSTNLLLFGLCGPFAGALMVRFGLRKVMLSALATLASAVAISTQMTAAWQLVALWGVMVGLGAGAMALVLGATVATRWFIERRGLVTGVFAASTATGQLIFLPVQATVVELAGWRTALGIVASVAVVVGVLVAVFMRDQPSQVGLLPYGAEDKSEAAYSGSLAPTEATDPKVAASSSAAANPFQMALATLAEGLRTRDFWLLCGSFAVCGATTVGLISVHLIPASVEHGLPEVTAASMLAAMGVFDLIGTTVSGWLSDRISARALLVWYYTLRGLALLFLPAAYELGVPALAGFVVFYGLDWVATVPPTVRLVADRFGKQRVGPFFGWVFASHQLGGALAAFGAGAAHTWLGDYLVAFLVAGALCLLASGLVLGLGRDARTLDFKKSGSWVGKFVPEGIDPAGRSSRG
jgi:sugar phosphate permease